jgi:hypothetical protein
MLAVVWHFWIAVALVEVRRGGEGEIVERGPVLGELDHLDRAVELAAALVDVSHAQGVRGFEVAALELAVEVLDALLAAQPVGLLAQARPMGRQRSGDLQELRGLTRPLGSAQLAGDGHESLDE